MPVRVIRAADRWLHKQANVPYDGGSGLAREAAWRYSPMAPTVSHVPLAAGRDPSRLTPELSRQAREMETWAGVLHQL